jgi:hypothetical protein
MCIVLVCFYHVRCNGPCSSHFTPNFAYALQALWCFMRMFSHCIRKTSAVLPIQRSAKMCYPVSVIDSHSLATFKGQATHMAPLPAAGTPTIVFTCMAVKSMRVCSIAALWQPAHTHQQQAAIQRWLFA